PARFSCNFSAALAVLGAPNLTALSARRLKRWDTSQQCSRKAGVSRCNAPAARVQPFPACRLHPSHATLPASKRRIRKVNPFIKAAQLRQKLPGYFVARAHALNHQTLQHLAAHHREKFLKAHKYIQANIISGIQVNRGIVSHKHDGLSTYFYWEKGHSPFLFHMPSCGVEVGLPAAEELGKELEARGHASALLAGELIVDQSRSHSYEVMRAVNSPENQAALSKLRFAIFDVILLDRQEKGKLGYDERVKITGTLPKTKLTFPIEFQEVKSLEELNAFYQAQISAGGEGIVLHELATQVPYKIKPKFNIDLAIVGYVEGTEEL